MATQVLPTLPDEIVSKIIELCAEESVYNLAGWLRAGKRGYALAHERSVLKTCDVSEMVLYVTCQIREGGKFRALHLKCVDAGNTRAIYHEGLLKAPTSEGLHASIKILEPNIPNHDMSTLAVGIFNVFLGKEKEAAMIFRQFASYHYDLQSEMIVEVGESIQWHLERFGAFDLNINKYEDTFKFPDDLIIKTPRCLYGHDYRRENIYGGSCPNCRLFWLCVNISQIL
ncbi:hypothetical protein Bca4012_083590 [Brassica carinata]